MKKGCLPRFNYLFILFSVANNLLEIIREHIYLLFSKYLKLKSGETLHKFNNDKPEGYAPPDDTPWSIFTILASSSVFLQDLPDQTRMLLLCFAEHASIKRENMPSIIS